MFTNSATELSGERIIQALKDARITHVVSVPDITTSDGLLWPISRDPDLTLIRVCKEDEAIGIAAGIAACDGRAAILIQNTGLYYAMNAIRAVGIEYSQPLCLFVGLLLRDPDKPLDEDPSFGVRLIRPVLEALGMKHTLVESDADSNGLAAAIDAVFSRSCPHAFLIGRSPRK